MFKIEKGVEAPERRGKTPLYPFADMTVGDCFKFPAIKRNVISVSAARFNKTAKLHGKCITIRKIDEDTCGCWLVAIDPCSNS